ncbi:MAG TPA: prepilin-type N-terminal cleavage/methylation domain-containing protein [Candidatus Acidoferrum sp.]
MKSANTMRYTVSRQRSAARGFTLIELMIAITVFLVIGGAAMSLFKQHASLFSDQQYQIGLNVSLRNALAQMENDVVNAGTGWYNGVNSVASWPIGATIKNQITGGAACHPPNTAIYNASCFDTLTVITPDPQTPPGMVAGATCSLTGKTAPGPPATSTMLITPVAPVTQAQLLSGYVAGGGFTINSQVIFVHVGTSGTTMTTAVLTANAAASGTNVLLTYGATRLDGTNGLAANDKLNLTLDANYDPNMVGNNFTDQFCGGTDWVVKVSPTIYSVDTSVANNPTLTRTLGANVDPLASQIIGFKVGASTVTLNGTSMTGSTGAYCYDASSSTTPCYDFNYNEIRSIRISLIGRTPPSIYQSSNSNLFLNTFDNQPYKIQSLSIIVNPRNLSMND